MPAAQHICTQADKIAAIAIQAERVEKEVYVGREGRQSVMVRLDRTERVVNKLTYISTALLVVALASLGSMLVKLAWAYTSGCAACQ